jgi:hypothetical protein
MMGTMTHTLALPDGYGTALCEVISEKDGLALVRIADNAFWEPPRSSTRVVRASCLSQLVDGEDAD